MEDRVLHFKKASKDKSGGKERNERPKRKGVKNISTARSTSEAGERLPLIGPSWTRSTEKSVITTHAGKRKRPQPPISSAFQNSFMSPWEGSSNSASSFTSIPTAPAPLVPSPPSPRPPPPITSSEIFPSPPRAIRDTNPDSQRSVRVKRQLLSFRGSSRPQRLPPLCQVTNLSFSRSFTFSFFELPWHQSMQSRSDRLKELVVLLKKIQY